MFVGVLSGFAGGIKRKPPETTTRSSEKEGESVSVHVMDEQFGESVNANINIPMK